MSVASWIKPGVRVLTENLGPGVVVRTTHTGALVSLEGLGGLEVELPRERLKPETPVASDGQAQSRPEKPKATNPPLPDRDAPASTPQPPKSDGFLNAVEALRFGIVPVGGLQKLTLGFNELETWVKSCMPDGPSGPVKVSEVCGPFGTGKSHTMGVIRLIARSRGYVTAHVEVNGSSVSLSDPGGLLFQLWRTVDAADLASATPILDLYLRAAGRADQSTRRELAPYPRVLSNFETVSYVRKKGILDDYSDQIDAIVSGNNDFTASHLRNSVLKELDLADAWYEEVPIRPMRLVSNPIADRPRDFLQCLLGYAKLAELAGFRGLVITVDEFEVEYVSQALFDRTKSLVHSMANSFRARPQAPLSIFFATVGQEGHVGDAVVDMVVSATSGSRHVLRPIQKAARVRLAERISRLYSEAHQNSSIFDPNVVALVEKRLDRSDVQGSGLIRAFIKGYLAEVDSRLGPPSKE